MCTWLLAPDGLNGAALLLPAAGAAVPSLGPDSPGDELYRFETLFAQPDLLVVELNAAVVELATQLRANHGLRTPDALQAACCLQLGPDAVMITGDAAFERVQALQVHLVACT